MEYMEVRPVTVVTVDEVIEALEGDFDGKRCGGMMHNGRGSYCCLGVMGRLAGIEPDDLVVGNPWRLEEDDQDRFVAAFPWLVNSEGRLSSVDMDRLMEANDGMPEDDPSFAVPVVVLRNIKNMGLFG